MVVYPSYFIDIITLYHLFHSDNVIIDVRGSYIKQTYRNRCYIAAANGKLALNIPIVHQQTKDSVPFNKVPIDHQQNWASNHLKSIKSAYKSSPYFEYYQDEFEALFKDIPVMLMEWNIKTMSWVLEKLNVCLPLLRTNEYLHDDLANQLIIAKQAPMINLPEYIQVFQEKHGFLFPLSGLDLLFNLGPAARSYLKNIPKPIYG